MQETPLITAPCTAALEPNKWSSRRLLEAGSISNVIDCSTRRQELMELLAGEYRNHCRSHCMNHFRNHCMNHCRNHCRNHSRLQVAIRTGSDQLLTERNVLISASTFQHFNPDYKQLHTARLHSTMQVVGRRPVTVEDGFDPRPVHVGLMLHTHISFIHHSRH